MPLRITRGCRLLAGARSRRGDRSATPASAARGGRRRCPCARPCLLASSSCCSALCPVSSPGEAGGSRGAPVCPHLLERRGMASHPAQSLWKNGLKALGQLEADVEPTRLASINVRQLEAGWGRHCSLARFWGSVLGLGSLPAVGRPDRRAGNLAQARPAHLIGLVQPQRSSRPAPHSVPRSGPWCVPDPHWLQRSSRSCHVIAIGSDGTVC